MHTSLGNSVFERKLKLHNKSFVDFNDNSKNISNEINTKINELFQPFDSSFFDKYSR
jgi:hypothetical protein